RIDHDCAHPARDRLRGDPGLGHRLARARGADDQNVPAAAAERQGDLDRTTAGLMPEDELPARPAAENAGPDAHLATEGAATASERASEGAERREPAVRGYCQITACLDVVEVPAPSTFGACERRYCEHRTGAGEHPVHGHERAESDERPAPVHVQAAHCA